jgi:Rrf2 family protein
MMKLSTRGRYATRICVYLGLRPENERARKRDIADAEGISADYVEQILVKLRTAGIVESHRGVKGGFTLSGDPEKISVADIVEAAEGPIHLVPCLKEGCERASACVTQEVWQRATGALREVFCGVTVADLVREARRHIDSNTIQFEI